MRTRDSAGNMRKPGVSGAKKAAVPDYDFTNGIRGKYAGRYEEGTNIVVLSPELAEVFPDSEAVNEALRTLVRISGKRVGVRPSRKKVP